MRHVCIPGWHMVNYMYNGVVYFTTNGTYWTEQWVPPIITSIDYGYNLGIAVGASGSILTSILYSSWTNQVSGTTDWLNGIGHGSNVFVVVGGAGTLLTSSDGKSWTSRNTGITNILRSVAYGNGRSEEHTS